MSLLQLKNVLFLERRTSLRRGHAMNHDGPCLCSLLLSFSFFSLINPFPVWGGHFPFSRGGLSCLKQTLSIPLPVHVLVANCPPPLSCHRCAFSPLAHSQVLVRMLHQLGFDADSASDGEQALDKWGGGLYALVLLDISLPKLDAFHVTAEIRHTEHTRGQAWRTRIIGLGGPGGHSTLPECQAAGMDELLRKPVAMAVLASAVTDLVLGPVNDPLSQGLTHSDNPWHGYEHGYEGLLLPSPGKSSSGRVSPCFPLDDKDTGSGATGPGGERLVTAGSPLPRISSDVSLHGASKLTLVADATLLARRRRWGSDDPLHKHSLGNAHAHAHAQGHHHPGNHPPHGASHWSHLAGKPSVDVVLHDADGSVHYVGGRIHDAIPEIGASVMLSAAPTKYVPSPPPHSHHSHHHHHHHHHLAFSHQTIAHHRRCHSAGPDRRWVDQLAPRADSDTSPRTDTKGQACEGETCGVPGEGKGEEAARAAPGAGISTATAGPVSFAGDACVASSAGGSESSPAVADERSDGDSVAGISSNWSDAASSREDRGGAVLASGGSLARTTSGTEFSEEERGVLLSELEAHDGNSSGAACHGESAANGCHSTGTGSCCQRSGNGLALAGPGKTKESPRTPVAIGLLAEEAQLVSALAPLAVSRRDDSGITVGASPRGQWQASPSSVTRGLPPKLGLPPSHVAPAAICSM
eukprot:jgi/Mesvir1/23487/Mv22333-RA.2